MNSPLQRQTGSAAPSMNHLLWNKMPAKHFQCYGSMGPPCIEVARYKMLCLQYNSIQRWCWCLGDLVRYWVVLTVGDRVAFSTACPSADCMIIFTSRISFVATPRWFGRKCQMIRIIFPRHVAFAPVIHPDDDDGTWRISRPPIFTESSLQ